MAAAPTISTVSTYDDVLGPFADALEAAGSFELESMRPFVDEGFDASIWLVRGEHCLVTVRYEHPHFFCGLHHCVGHASTPVFEEKQVVQPTELLTLLREYAPLTALVAE